MWRWLDRQQKMVAAILEQEQISKKRRYEEATRDHKKRVKKRTRKEMRVIWTAEKHRTKDSWVTHKEEEK
jgi:hypothetical protein